MATLTIVCPTCYTILEQDWDLDFTDRVEAIEIMRDEAQLVGECWRNFEDCHWREAREGEVTAIEPDDLGCEYGVRWE